MITATDRPRCVEAFHVHRRRIRVYSSRLWGIIERLDAKKSPKIAIWAPSRNFVGIYLRN